MSSAKSPSLFSSVSFRLTTLSIAIFSICLAIVLTVFYYIAQSFIFTAADASIIYELQEAEDLFRHKGYEILPSHLIEEAGEYDSSKIYFRIIDQNGQITATSDVSKWEQLPSTAFPKTKGIRKEYLETQVNPKEKNYVRIISMPLNDTLYVEGGLKLNHELDLLSLYRLALPLTGIVIIVLAASAVYLTARSAMKRVDEMTLLATSISASQLNSRLPEWPHEDELSRLSKTFNKLLARIETLVKGMKTVTDDIAHDLKMPITRMRTRADLAITPNPADSINELAANTVEECDHVLNMLDSMLDISEAEAKLVKLKIEELDLDNLLKTAVELFEPVAEQKNISLCYSSDGSKIIEGDISKLQRAFSNLIDNAIKYTPNNGKVSVSLSATNSSTKVTVIDTGIGMSEDELPLIFERFYRADTSRSGIGNGLGLTMSKAFIEAHNGIISVASEKNVGTVIAVHLS